MTPRFVTALTAALCVAAGAAAAQEQAFPSAFLDGVYSSEPDCASGHNPLRDDGVTYLTEDGLSAIEYLCEFLSYDGVPGSDAFVAVTACSAPGELTPELILVRRLSVEDGPASKVSVQYHGDLANPTEFFRCPAE